MSHNESFTFPCYLAAKKTVDDRALNRSVWQALKDALAGPPEHASLQVLEIGAGIGTMIERVLDWDLLRRADYTAIDASEENVAAALQRLPEWAKANGWSVQAQADGSLRLENGARQVTVRLETSDVFEWITRQPAEQFDLLIAHAVLDLFDLQTALPRILGTLRPGGFFYFTLNFDGVTIFAPPLDPDFDEQVIAAYHQTMDERQVEGHPSGDSRTGRRLFHLLPAAGGEILNAGSSDWVVHARQGAYPADEAYFLHFILYFFEDSLAGRSELDPQRMAAWLAGRHAQVERGTLAYIAHQIDFFGSRRRR